MCNHSWDIAAFTSIPVLRESKIAHFNGNILNEDFQLHA